MSTTQSPLLANLNDEQRLAVCHSGGPALVIAGAGSGKTRVLTHRIAHLISEGVAAHHILAVTFTNKAAAEMKQRVESLCGLQPSLWIGTFHSMCARLLRSEIHRLGMQSNFVIVDDQDQLTLIKEALRELNIDDKVYRPQLFREQIGRAKNRLLTPQKLQDQMAGLPQNIAASVYTQYQKKLFANNAVDFDDLLMATVMLLQKDKEVLAQYQAKFHHVLIDEYQDTNHAQYVLVRLLSGGSQHVMAVGDEDQSIYSFRGAEIHNILDFERDFPDTTIYRLQQNYRSTQRILNAANALIRNNRQRKGKTLWTQNGQGEKVKAFEAADEREEVDVAALASDVRADLFRHLQRLSLGYYDTHIVGVTVSRVINDVATISDLLSQGLITLLGDLLILVGIIGVMLSLSPRLALLTFVVLPLMALVIAGIAFAVFNAVMGADATFKQVYAVVAHSGVVIAVQQLFVLPLDYARETMSSPTNLMVFLPFLDESSFVARLLGSIDLFVIWWGLNLAIGLGVLYHKRTAPIAITLIVVYVAIGLIIAAVKTATSGA